MYKGWDDLTLSLIEACIKRSLKFYTMTVLIVAIVVMIGYYLYNTRY